MTKIVLTTEQGKHLGLSKLPWGLVYDGEYQLLHISIIEINEKVQLRHYLCLETHDILEVLEDHGNTQPSYTKVKCISDIFKELQTLKSTTDDMIVLSSSGFVEVLISASNIYFKRDGELRELSYIEDYMYELNNQFTPYL